MSLPKTVTVMFASVAAFASLPAVAASTSDVITRTVEVPIAGYDLTDPQDARIVFSKIQRAAKRVCRNSNGERSIRERAEAVVCQSNAIASAVSKLDTPALTKVMFEDRRSQ